jgi:hypothetical protein
LAFSWDWWAEWALRKVAANSAQLLVPIMSTLHTASNLGRGGSMPNKQGGSAIITQRQNFFSAVIRRC